MRHFFIFFFALLLRRLFRRTGKSTKLQWRYLPSPQIIDQRH